MKKDINEGVFPEETLLKLRIFAECFREWFPVFLYSPFVHSIRIYDFFAGSGQDALGNKGSPLILLDEAKGNNRQYCGANNKEVIFHFNEGDRQKVSNLRTNAGDFLANCSEANCKSQCRYSEPVITGTDFKEMFSDAVFQSVLRNEKIAKFILLDQYGYSQVDEDIFKRLISSPMTDFIFFVSSSFIRRFKDHPSTKKYVETHKIPFNAEHPRECHRQMADYYQSLIPSGREYYIHNFTIKKGSNYWGLIFGSSHTFGMEKFLKVCWGIDVHSGESNFNIDKDWEVGTLFHQPEISNKKQQIKDEVRKMILSGEINDNIAGFKCVLRKRGLPILFTEVVKELEKAGQISRTGELNYTSTGIHKAKEYRIHLQPKEGVK